MKNLLKFHHFGLALRSLNEAKLFYSKIGYKVSKKYTDNLQKVNLMLCTSNKMPTIELISPINKSSPISTYLNKLNEVFYHSCFEVKNLNSIEILKKKFNAKCVSQRKESILFKGKLVSFYYLKNIGLLEIIENNASKK